MRAPYRVIAGAFLLLAMLPLPYGFFQLLRLVIFVAAGIAAFEDHGQQREAFAITFVVVGLLFNPFVRVTFSREIWLGLDFCVATLFIVSHCIARKGKQCEHQESKS